LADRHRKTEIEASQFGQEGGDVVTRRINEPVVRIVAACSRAVLSRAVILEWTDCADPRLK
jgi:hypothetical protein